MRRRKFSFVAVAALTLVLPIVGPATQSQAASCDFGIKWTSTSLSNSEKFAANAGCKGVWAHYTATYTDYIRGWYYRDGSWKKSSYGWQVVFWSGDLTPKIVGDTTTGRNSKGQSATFNQDVVYEF
ncbi:MAG: hypothetical protein QM619_06060 [Micropruina sp.]|uniref:hypothetical protein n=1 Tax=Micropruina sp. TaxID=2737536 RepID=UPI0039E2BDDA